MKIDPNQLQVWIQVGAQLVNIGAGALAKIRGALSSTDETGNAMLDTVIADYDRRIAAREQDAVAPPSDPPV